VSGKVETERKRRQRGRSSISVISSVSSEKVMEGTLVPYAKDLSNRYSYVLQIINVPSTSDENYLHLFVDYP
jgi:hypothetical protein